MKYKGIFLYLIKILIRQPMNRKYSRAFTKSVLKKIKPIYKEMLAKTEDIGFENPMANNIYMSYVFFAIWKAAEGEITPVEFKEVITEFMSNSLVTKYMGGMDVNEPAAMRKMEDKFHQMAEWAEEHLEYKDKTWDFNFDKTLHRDGTYYHYTRCPIEKFARENGYLEILPVICDIDFLTAKAKGAVLHREQTLATGGKMCDYWFVGDKVENPQ